jgi:hypothetical protein
MEKATIPFEDGLIEYTVPSDAEMLEAVQAASVDSCYENLRNLHKKDARRKIGEHYPNSGEVSLDATIEGKHCIIGTQVTFNGHVTWAQPNIKVRKSHIWV